MFESRSCDSRDKTNTSFEHVKTQLLHLCTLIHVKNQTDNPFNINSFNISFRVKLLNVCINLGNSLNCTYTTDSMTFMISYFKQKSLFTESENVIYLLNLYHFSELNWLSFSEILKILY